MQAVMENTTLHSVEPLLEKVHQIGPQLGQDIQAEEIDRRISAQTLALLRKTQLHKLFLPKSLGGLELDPPGVARLTEAVSSYNTAAGWSMMVANTAQWWCWRLPEQGIEMIFQDGENVFIAGAFHPPMFATRIKGGFRINGRTPLCSNVHDSNYTFVTALVVENGQPVMHEGIPEMIGVIMKTTDIIIFDNWDTIGMKATDSCDIGAENVFVPGELSFPLAPAWEPNRYFEGVLYQFPALGASIASLISPVAIAVARNAIEEVKTLANKKTSFGSVTNLAGRGAMQNKIGKAEALVRSARHYLYDELESAWHKCISGHIFTLEEKAGLLLTATHCNQSCFQAVDLMYSVGGTAGIYTRSKLSHLFMDAQVIRQHGFANESRYETGAQVLLGLQPDLPVLAF